MKLIVAVDQNWGIGYEGKLLEIIPADMKYFKEKTIGKVVVMGRATFESLPGGRPLQDRINIVLTKNCITNCGGIIVCSSLAALFKETKKYNSEEIFVIGGESIYEQLITYCSEAYVTKIDKSYIANKYFPDLDALPGWKLVEEGSLHSYRDIDYRFMVYKNKARKSWPTEE